MKPAKRTLQQEIEEVVVRAIGWPEFHSLRTDCCCNTCYISRAIRRVFAKRKRMAK